MLNALPHELRLVAACCRPPAQPGRDCAIQAAWHPTIDCMALLREAHAHRVDALVEHGLAQAEIALPADAAALLSARARAGRLQMLRNAGEEVRLSGLLAEAGVEPLFVKGATLAMLAYGSLAHKTSWDIDMLVDRRQIDRAIDVLRDAGYAFDHPTISDPQEQRRFAAHVRESAWTHVERKTTVELHWALASNPAMLTGIGAQPARQHVNVTGTHQVPTLATPDLFAFLAVHGMAHGWSRLKWLADIAALTDGCTESLASLLDHARSRNAGRCAAVACALMRDLLGMRLPDDVEVQLGQDRHVKPLATYCVRTMQETVAATGGLDHRLTRWWEQHWAAMVMAPGVHGGIASVWAKLHDQTEPRRLRLPRWLLVPDALLIWLPAALLRRMRAGQRAASGKAASTP